MSVTWGASGEAVPAVAQADARLKIDGAGRLRDGQGRDVVLRGINAGGRAKWAPFVPFPIDPGASLEAVEAAAEVFFARLGPWGLDTVRLTFSWEALEPTCGQLDERYFDRYRTMVDVAWRHGVRAIVDFHQDIYASPFSGDGFPVWTLGGFEPGPPRHDDPLWFFKYVQDEGVKRAFDRFWADEGGIRRAFEGMWRTMASRLVDHPGVVGFEIINEPGWGSAPDVDVWKREVLTPFHTRMIEVIRGVAPEALIFYDGPGIDALSRSVSHCRPSGSGLVFAPHLYDPGLIMSNPWTGMEPEPSLQALARFRDEAATPILLGEFGIGDGAEGGPAWLDRAMNEIDRLRLSATLWEYSQGEERWNGEDLSVLSFEGEERAVLDVYVRPWVRALSGRGLSFGWDNAAGTASARWTAEGGVTEIVIPSRRFPEGPRAVEISGEGARATFDPGRGELRVGAEVGAEVEVRFAVGV